MSNYRGDFALGSTARFKFTTVDSSGVAAALDSTSVIVWYADDSTAASTAGLSVSLPFNSTTAGLNHVKAVLASTNGFAAGTDVEVVILSGSAGGKSLAGYVVGGLSIENRSALRPTVAARTLDVTANGNAGIDWANVENPTTALNLSGTNIDTDQVVASVTGAVGSVTGAVGSVTGAVGSVTGNVGGNVTGSVGSVAAGGIAAASFAAGAIDASAIAANAIGAAEIADGAIDAATFAAGAINAAATANDFLAEVNAEVVDALATDTYAEPGQGAPAATASLAAKIGYLYKGLRNKQTQTATTWSLFADDATTVDQKATVSDDGVTFTRSEIATGP